MSFVSFEGVVIMKDLRGVTNMALEKNRPHAGRMSVLFPAEKNRAAKISQQNVSPRYDTRRTTDPSRTDCSYPTTN